MFDHNLTVRLAELIVRQISHMAFVFCLQDRLLHYINAGVTFTSNERVYYNV